MIVRVWTSARTRLRHPSGPRQAPHRRRAHPRPLLPLRRSHRRHPRRDWRPRAASTHCSNPASPGSSSDCPHRHPAPLPHPRRKQRPRPRRPPRRAPHHPGRRRTLRRRPQAHPARMTSSTSASPSGTAAISAATPTASLFEWYMKPDDAGFDPGGPPGRGSRRAPSPILRGWTLYSNDHTHRRHRRE
jgi:hypothetical protein